MPRSDDELERIEAQYRRSHWVKEICATLVAIAPDGEATRLQAVVVPDMAAIRKSRIVNIGDLLRFEIEGQSIHLARLDRVNGYEISFDALPRTFTGTIDREQVRASLARRRAGIGSSSASDSALSQATGDRCGTAVVEALMRRGKQRPLTANANLEIDLGFDSIERVELIAELEHRFSRRLDDDRALNILTVSHLLEAFCVAGASAGDRPMGDDWELILRDLPPVSDRTPGWLLDQRPLSTAGLFVLMRLLRLLLPPIVVTGREHLPRRGPYIISPNHQSYLDPFVVCGALSYALVRQCFALGAAEYFATPFTAWLARRCSLLPVDPDANLVSAMRGAAFALEHGRILIVFPEGERSIDGTVKRFKKGVAILARRLEVPVIPVAIRGMFEVWPRNRPFNWRTLLPGTAHRVQIAFGPPMALKESANDAEAASALQARVSGMWNALNASPEQRRDC